VENQIGLGGMGVVYLVQHTALNKQFALKVLAPDLVNEQNWLRFQAEAKTMASLSHRTFVKVYDLGIHAKAVPFYSMDYLKGRSLETIVIEDGPFQLEQALDIFLEVLDGLAYAHRHNIIHRDIKPANIMLCTAGSAKTATTDSTSPSPSPSPSLSLSLSNSASDSLPTAVKVLDFGIS
jgi:serine/threonine-protein kinase